MFGSLEVWYNPDSIAIIISLKIMTQQYKNTYDSKDRGSVFMFMLMTENSNSFATTGAFTILTLKRAEVLMVITLEENFEV